MTKSHCNLSLVILATNEVENLVVLLPQVRSALDLLDAVYEIIIVDNQANEYTHEVMRQNRCRLLCPSTPGYGVALVAGIQQATGDYIIVMSADQAHPAAFLRDLWTARDTADVVIASRYISNGQATMPFARKMLSKVLNFVFSRGLDLSVRDMSSGSRLYKSSVIKGIVTKSTDYVILQEICQSVDGRLPNSRDPVYLLLAQQFI